MVFYKLTYGLVNTDGSQEWLEVSRGAMKDPRSSLSSLINSTIDASSEPAPSQPGSTRARQKSPLIVQLTSLLGGSTAPPWPLRELSV